jgi:hypothetical protein
MGKATTQLGLLLGGVGGGTGLGWAPLGIKEKKIVGRLRIWVDRLRKIRNSLLFFKSFYNFQTNLNSIQI